MNVIKLVMMFMTKDMERLFEQQVYEVLGSQMILPLITEVIEYAIEEWARRLFAARIMMSWHAYVSRNKKIWGIYYWSQGDGNVKLEISIQIGGEFASEVVTTDNKIIWKFLCGERLKCVDTFVAKCVSSHADEIVAELRRVARHSCEKKLRQCARVLG